jgi:hypothetical protein
MSEKSDRLGLLSKMALFVRNPTKDWAELDRAEPAAESGYDKHALKAMIERKRQNDFVRRREFDQLRKLRLKEGGSVLGQLRPSIFQSSVVTDPDGRAVTLKKIDEIEAQMSKQWWKGKGDPSHGHPQVPGFPVAAAPVGGDAHQPSYFQTTLGVEPDPTGTDFDETQMGAGMASAGVVHPRSASGPVTDRFDAPDVGFSTSKLFATEGGDMATDPELEEAAIRFANGDDTGAESGLLLALRGNVMDPEITSSWFAALLDLYRATRDREKFDLAIAEFGFRFTERKPTWERVARRVADALSNAPDLLWDCPENLDVQAMESLRELLSTRPMPWSLGWSRLAGVSVEAMPLLESFFSSVCEESVALRFFGADRLIQILCKLTPAGDSSVSPAWWSARLSVLRALQLEDEFQLAALDYCVTFEVAPPPWQSAHCTCENLPALTSGSPLNRSFSDGESVPSGVDVAAGVTLTLNGEVLGDASQVLSGMGGGNVHGVPIVICCATLVRVDFSAAGSILNWVALRHADGVTVRFDDVNRLVAAFFNVIGINEHARVVPQSI